MSENSFILPGLIAKRDQLAKALDRLDEERRQLCADLDAIDAAIRVIDPEEAERLYAERIAPSPDRARKHAVSRVIMRALRTAAPKPLSTLDLAVVVMKARGMSPDDGRARRLFIKRTSDALRKLDIKGAVERQGSDGPYAMWSVAKR